MIVSRAEVDSAVKKFNNMESSAPNIYRLKNLCNSLNTWSNEIRAGATDINSANEEAEGLLKLKDSIQTSISALNDKMKNLKKNASNVSWEAEHVKRDYRPR